MPHLPTVNAVLSDLLAHMGDLVPTTDLTLLESMAFQLRLTPPVCTVSVKKQIKIIQPIQPFLFNAPLYRVVEFNQTNRALNIVKLSKTWVPCASLTGLLCL